MGLDVFLVEFVPGPPDGTWTYYTYLDENGAPAYEFVKRVLRRFPADTGIGCFEISERCPELRELSLKLLRHVGLRGLAAVEFKRDERDQQLKLIECNARLSGATCLLAFRQMRRAGLISSRTWLRSLLCRKILPIFRWSDPLPSLANETSRLKGALGRRLRRCLAGVRALFRWKSP